MDNMDINRIEPSLSNRDLTYLPVCAFIPLKENIIP